MRDTQGACAELDAERAAQQALYAALQAAAPGLATQSSENLAPAWPEGWLPLPGRGDSIDADEGLQAYRRNATAIALRALEAAYPVCKQLVGEEAFSALARHLWHLRPPLQGDLGAWGGELAELVASLPAYADEPYLADVARLEWLVHRAETAADGANIAAGLERLGSQSPDQLGVRFQPGFKLLHSAHPVVSIWRAHRGADAAQAGEESPFDTARAKLALGLGEVALVRRAGWRVSLEELDSKDAPFTLALLQGQSLGQALTESPPSDFEAWLLRALREAWLQEIFELTLNPSESLS